VRGKIILIILLLISAAFNGMSQDISIHGRFDRDTIRIGEEAAYLLSIVYSGHYRVILPDSSSHYGDFQYLRRNWFPTRNQGSQAYDSIIYYFTTFNLDSVQYLDLPVYVLQETDCLTFYSPMDSLILRQVITQPTDTLSFKANTLMLRVKRAVNYPLLLISAGILIIFTTIITIIFGRRITKRYRIYRMHRRHLKFTRKFYSKLGMLRDYNSGPDLEHVLLDWKKYMEALEKEPYTKLTTRELIQIHNDTVLRDNLRALDRFIYGNIKDRPMHEHLMKLLEYSVTRFNVRIKEIQDGK
jgi:hypothetical protein